MLKLAKVLWGILIGLVLLIWMASNFVDKKEPNESNAEQKNELTITQKADVESWFFDDVKAGSKLAKGLGSNLKNYHAMSAAAAYMVANTIKSGKVVDVVSLDGKKFTVQVQDGENVESYDIATQDLKDKSGKYYDDKTALNAPIVKSRSQIKQERYESSKAKALPDEIARSLVVEVIKKNANHPSTVDIDTFGRQDNGIYDDGTREYLYGFSAKNSFGVEMHYEATVQVTPKGKAKIVNLAEK